MLQYFSRRSIVSFPTLVMKVYGLEFSSGELVEAMVYGGSEIENENDHN